MWKPFATEHSAYLISYNNDQDEIEIFLSNLKSLWSGNFTKECLCEMFKELNPSLELEDVSSQVIQIFDGIDNTQTNIIDSNETLKMKVFSCLSQDTDYKVPIELEFTLALAEDEKLKELITVPMVQTIDFLETQQRILCNVIRKKDRELEEYRLEKGVISRSDLVTEPFDLSLLTTSTDKLLLNTFQKSKRFLDHINKFQNMEVPVAISLPESLQEKNVKRKRRIYQGGTVTKYSGFYGEKPDTKHIKIEQHIKTEKQ